LEGVLQRCKDFCGEGHLSLRKEPEDPGHMCRTISSRITQRAAYFSSAKPAVV